MAISMPHCSVKTPGTFQNREFQQNTPVKGPGPKRGQKLLEFFAATTAGCKTLLLPNSFQTAAPRCGQALYPALSAYPSDSSWVTACDNAKSTPHPTVVLKFQLALPPMATKSYGSGWWHGSRSHDSHRDKGIDPLPSKKWPSICRPSPNRHLTCGMSRDSPVKMNKETPSQKTKWRFKKTQKHTVTSVNNGVCPVPRAFLAICDSKLHPWRTRVTIADVKRGETCKLVQPLLVRSHATELMELTADAKISWFQVKMTRQCVALRFRIANSKFVQCLTQTKTKHQSCDEVSFVQFFVKGMLQSPSGHTMEFGFFLAKRLYFCWRGKKSFFKINCCKGQWWLNWQLYCNESRGQVISENKENVCDCLVQIFKNKMSRSIHSQWFPSHCLFLIFWKTYRQRRTRIRPRTRTRPRTRPRTRNKNKK